MIVPKLYNSTTFIVRQIVRLTFLNFLNFIFLFVPKKKNLILFGAWGGKKFLDNPKHLFKYSLTKHDGINKFWVTKSRILFNDLQKRGLNVVYAYSIEGLMLQAQASVLVFSHSVEMDFVSYMIKPSCKRLQLWHGTPIKKIEYSDKFNLYSRSLMKLVNFLMPFYKDTIDACIAIGEYDKKIYSLSFNVKKENIITTGYPRNDILFSQNNKKGTKILYLPTFRSDESLFKSLLYNDVFNDRNNEFLKNIGLELFVKLHPAQKLEIQNKNFSNIKIIKQDVSNDIYEELTSFTWLITDISGIFFDVLLTETKVYTYFPDIDTYKKNERDLFYSISDVSVTQNYSSFFMLINDINNNLYDEVRHKYLLEKYHSNKDGDSSRRVYKLLTSKFLR